MSFSQPILITGSSGRLGSVLLKHYQGRYPLLTPSRHELDLGQPEKIQAALAPLTFGRVIHCAAISNPDVCEVEKDLAMRVNAEASGAIAQECARRGVPMIHISTDYVFSGNGRERLDENAKPQPINHYGHTKHLAEERVLAALPHAAIVARVSWLFGADNAVTFPDQILQKARSGQTLEAIDDKWSAPTSMSDIAHWLEALWQFPHPYSGILHLCNSGEATWKTYAEAILEHGHHLGLLKEVPKVKGNALAQFTGFKAKRPPYTTLNNRKLAELLRSPIRDWQSALADWMQKRYT